MDVIATAATIGLTVDGGEDVLGTIEQQAVLDALSALSATHPGQDDLFAAAVTRVRHARSAGLERIEAGSVFAARRASLENQLCYRADMLDVFIDLAIDLGLRAGGTATAPVAG